MKMMKKALLFLCAIIMILPFTACQEKEDARILYATTAASTFPSSPADFETQMSESPSETETPESTEYNPYAVNPLTGIQDMNPENVGFRSVSVVINNTIEALPQRGITAADAIYEYETEGGQTRLLALYADANLIPEVGSLRSARIVACDLSAGTNSIFIHYGKNARVPDHIRSIGLDHVDGNDMSAQSGQSVDGYIELPKNLFFWRDNVWKTKRAIEHTAVTNGFHILRAFEARKVEREGDTPDLFSFDKNTTALDNGESCTNINVFFSNTNDDSLFVYDSDIEQYMKSQYSGRAQIDETNGCQISFTNVVVLYANIKPHGDTTLDAYLNDGGTGYYIAKGKIIPILWTKAGSNAPIVLTDEDENHISLYPGKTYINVVRNSAKSKTTWNG